ncbi:MAG: guanylate kinase [Elusimicrobia bacterium CG1_02_63_36]|nr:MAG: guanylate kinase [Elusimicrobia bacterium CG1_02_63_36]PIP83472.1 MAG: guanylate kinase [Elusimicrobia bacterium CG22_combo_CG10-13_8_21_14_all_63_91]PJA12318.1 MAG: guanylate kinase [Elusimicrobia bacterium CG_4_10_14_0_2_um_filter_63_34]PJB24730.1 MAG: guanylate kinase [Elusimicrobia bacterium CG_4_9_14_3_um_filter_62_55]
MQPGFLVIISAPSGGGKSTICRKLRRRDASLLYSVSTTTRAPRPSEIDGKHYHFVSEREFHRRQRRGAFLEWAKVHDNYYGTSKAFIDRETKTGGVVLMDIDVQGAATIRRRRKDAVTIFLIPPSMHSLRERLRLRKDTDTIETRMANARAELKQAKHYDYWVLNDSLNTAVKQVEAIILAERHRAGRQAPKGLRVPAKTAVRP